MGQKASTPHRVLVTGASGYIALHVINQLLKDGHKVRGTVRNLKDEKKIAPIRKLAKDAEQLELVEADLENADSWMEAVKDMEIVIHVASPFPSGEPEDQQTVIKPAVDGTLNVLRACAATDSKVKRVVVTSSGLAVFGYNWEPKTYTESDWPDVESQPSAYCKSKILAERAAWDFVEEKKKNKEPVFELSVINPVLVLGPLLSEVYGASAEWFLNVFDNKGDKVSNMSYPCCDVRDVALAHVKAAFLPASAGKRHLIVSSKEFVAMKTWAEILSKEFSSKGMKIPTESDGDIIGKTSKCDDNRMRSVLGIKPIDMKSTLIDMANSFIQLGIVKPQ